MVATSQSSSKMEKEEGVF